MKYKNSNLKKDFLNITKKLKLPAGDSKMFSTLENISKNKDKFFSNVHNTWKDIHYQAIGEIIKIDIFLSSENKNYLDKNFIWKMDYFRQLWRRVNDAIIWSIVGKRYIVKRLCLYRKRPPLTGANISAEMKVLNKLNKNPYNIAILNDATYCVDIGDIIWSNPKEDILRPIEIKEGKVNEIISDLFAYDPQSEEFEGKYESFLNEYGNKGFNQIERYCRQIERSNQMINLIKNEEGIDPYTMEKMKIIESSIELDFYDEQFDQLLEKAKNTGEGITLVDNCLWIYVSYSKEYKLVDHKKRFLNLIMNSKPKDTDYIVSVFDKSTEGRVIPLYEWISQHVSYPIFLRKLSVNNITELIAGGLLTNVFMYFNWNQFGNLFKKHNGKFNWSSKKEGRREKAKSYNKRLCLVIDERIPKIYYKKGECSFTGASLIQILFDGLRPSVKVAEISETFNNTNTSLK